MKAKTKRIWNILLEELALFSTELMLVIILGLVSIWGFIYIAQLLVNNQVNAFDAWAQSWMTSWQSPGMTMLMKMFTALGNPQVVIVFIALVVIYYLFIKPHRWFALRIPVVAAGSYVLNRLLKYWFDRPRPVEEGRMVEVLVDLSFPSGHAMFAFAFYGLFIHIIWKTVRNEALRIAATVSILIVIFFVGLSRVYLGVHYFSDVVAGFAAGFIWLLLCLFLLRRIEKMLKRREERRLMNGDTRKLPVMRK